MRVMVTMSTKKDDIIDLDERLSQFFSENSDLSDRLLAIKGELGTFADLAEASDSPSPTVKAWVGPRKTQPGIGAIVALAGNTDFSLDYICTGRAETRQDAEAERERLLALRSAMIEQWPDQTGVIDRAFTQATAKLQPILTGDRENPDLVQIPKLNVKAAAGNGLVAIDAQTSESIGFSRDWLQRRGLVPGQVQALTAVGDSMEPVIRDGDTLLIDRSITAVADNGIYVVVLAGMVMVKRVQIMADGSLTLRSDNPQYTPETIPAESQTDLVVEGRVRWVGRTY